MNKQLPAALICLWGIMQFCLYYTNGVKVVFDSERYLAEAQRLAQSGFSDIRLSYISYSLLLRVMLALTGTLKSIVALQVFFGGVATAAFFRLTMLVYQNQLISFVATALLILWPDFQHWHFYIHTESLFSSFTIIVFLRVVTARAWRHYLQLLLLLAFLVFLRANGFMVGLSVLSYYVVSYSIRKKYKPVWVGVVLMLVLIPLLVLAAHAFLGDMAGIHSFTGHLMSGTVLQGYNELVVAGAEEISLSGTPVQQILQLLIQEPVFFLKQSLLRVLWYWGQVRPYFSSIHNWLIVFYMYPLYFFMLRSIRQGNTPRPLLISLLTLFVLFTAMIVVSGVDWDNRFMMPLLPWVIMLGASGGQVYQKNRG